MRSVFAAALAALLAQTPPAFEVASIKPNPSPEVIDSVSLQPGGGVRMTGFRLVTLIVAAYESGTIQVRGQIIGGPPWIFTERFDIVAKADGDLMFDAQGRRPARAMAMLKTLLEDRFALKVHNERRSLPAFAMKLSRRDRAPGPGLHPSTIECPRYGAGGPAAQTPDPDRWCGFRRLGSSINARSVTMPEVATYFAAFAAVGRPIQDRTGLTGRFDLHVDLGEGQDAEAGALFTAFREQLGLRFDGERAAVPVIVIDHVAHPTPD